MVVLKKSYGQFSRNTWKRNFAKYGFSYLQLMHIFSAFLHSVMNVSCCFTIQIYSTDVGESVYEILRYSISDEISAKTPRL